MAREPFDSGTANDSMTAVDVVNVLRGGGVAVDQFDGTHWRYNVETQRMSVTICFRGHEADPAKIDPVEIRVITAWRKRP